ncbi:unnamed protein product [Acanthocheilonema viteae]|uniref:Uncharacterized protein n=1 Tax=Acanthocheilonema viteae TaxID=6277 RepID=A0A498S7G9_ACAVI|nr:unnamed protein product [Acanthocheilonema viteae]
MLAPPRRICLPLGGQQHGRKISPVNKLQVIEHMVSPKYEALPTDPVIDHLASFDSFSDLDPESRKQSSAEEHRNQLLLPELLGSSSTYE